jgi:hypothetical protein
MVSDHQVRKLKKMLSNGNTLRESSLKAGMDEKTARKYQRTGELPSESKEEHTWRTRDDPFEGVWEEVTQMLNIAPALEAVTIFEYLKDRYPADFADGQLRTLQRKIKRWRATEGHPKEVMFTQEHHPGRLAQSDFTHMSDLGITIARQPFYHLLYHLVLTKSNWETGSVCFSESFESLSEGFQRAIWELGGIPEFHQTDSLSVAVNQDGNPEQFTRRYAALMEHYGVKAKRINPGEAHENGDVEQSHFRLKKAIDQRLMLRGSRDFTDRGDYERFLRDIFTQRNRGRMKQIALEKPFLGPLPARKIDSFKELKAVVSRSSTIVINHNIYSLNSRLIGETVKVKVFAEYLEVWYAQKCTERIPRLRGEGKHRIQYRHVIDSLVRKPGAFENYKYKQDMFPSTRFRMVYDGLMKTRTARSAAKEYLSVLNLAAKESESLVEEAIRILLHTGTRIIDSTAVNGAFEALKTANQPPEVVVRISPVDPAIYDTLFASQEESWMTVN